MLRSDVDARWSCLERSSPENVQREAAILSFRRQINPQKGYHTLIGTVFGQMVTRMLIDHRQEVGRKTIDEIVIVYLDYVRKGKTNFGGTPNLLFVLSDANEI